MYTSAQKQIKTSQIDLEFLLQELRIHEQEQSLFAEH